MTIIVLDTNGLVSALLSARITSAQILKLVLEGELNLAVSRDILEEIYRVLGYPKLVKLMKKNGVMSKEVDSFIGRLCSIAIETPGECKPGVIQDDPSDDIILACAVEGEADFIISGDRHLTNLKEYQGITILHPASFLAFIRQEGLSE